MARNGPSTRLARRSAISTTPRMTARGKARNRRAATSPSRSAPPRASCCLPDGVLALRAAKGPQGQLMDDFLVLRLVTPPSGTGLGDLEGLGLSEDVLAELERERSSESGLLLMGGSTGDGKSTTLVRWLERVYIERAGRVSIVTVEDPIEFPARGSGFIQMVVAGGSSGAERRAAITETLSNFVRMNPTFGMVGEIRSVDDARETMQFVVSGHKIVTTIHAASANAALFRLIRLGVRPEEVAEPGVISLAMRQTLVPVLCPDCARPATPPERAIINAWAGNHTGNPEGAPMMRNRAGCPTCLPPEPGLSPLVLETRRAAWGGLSRRQAIAEYIRLDDTYREFLQARDALRAERYWRTPKEDGGMGGVPLDVIKARLVAEGRVDYTDASEKHLPGTAGDADGGGLGMSALARMDAALRRWTEGGAGDGPAPRATGPRLLWRRMMFTKATRAETWQLLADVLEAKTDLSEMLGTVAEGYALEGKGTIAATLRELQAGMGRSEFNLRLRPYCGLAERILFEEMGRLDAAALLSCGGPHPAHGTGDAQGAGECHRHAHPAGGGSGGPGAVFRAGASAGDGGGGGFRHIAPRSENRCRRGAGAVGQPDGPSHLDRGPDRRAGGADAGLDRAGAGVCRQVSALQRDAASGRGGVPVRGGGNGSRRGGCGHGSLRAHGGGIGALCPLAHPGALPRIPQREQQSRQCRARGGAGVSVAAIVGGAAGAVEQAGGIERAAGFLERWLSRVEDRVKAAMAVLNVALLCVFSVVLLLLLSVMMPVFEQLNTGGGY